jgi:hypothetical protein
MIGGVGTLEFLHRQGAVRPLLSNSELGIDRRGRPLPEKSRKIEKSFHDLDRIESKSDGKAGCPLSLGDIDLPDIGSKTFKVFEAPAQLQHALHDYIRDISGPKQKLLFCQTMSPRQLETAHLAVGWLAPHVDPSQPGMHTGSLNDQKLLRVLWQMSPPEDGDLHPPESRMVDGRLIAVWRTSTERSCSPKLLKKFTRLQGRVADRLGGNKYALEQNIIKRVLGGLQWRFHSLFRGGKEGIANPRNKGRILAIVVLGSVPTSVAIYAIVYGIQYNAVKHEMYQMRSQKANAAGLGGAPSPAPPAMPAPLSGGHHSQQGSGAPPPYSAQTPFGPPPPYSAAAPAYPAPPAYAGPSGNGSISLSA